MAGQSVTPRLDHKAIAAGLGKLKASSGGESRLLDANGKTLAYLRKRSVVVRVAHANRPPKKLGVFRPEANGVWTSVGTPDNAAARAVLEWVAARAGQA